MAAPEHGQFTAESAQRIGEAVQYVEGLRKNNPTGSRTRPIESGFYLGKPDQDLTQGVLSGATVSVWKGPAWGDQDEDLGVDIQADYATQDFLAGDYVALTRYKGKWYVSCFIPSSSGGGV